MKLNIGKKDYDIAIADKLRHRLRGLSFEKDLDCGILFPKSNKIHTFFCENKIDIVGLDENNKVIYKYENIDKNKIIKIKHERKKTSILALPKNTSKKIRIGELLVFESEDII